MDQVHRGAGEQPIHVCGLGAVAAQDSMPAQEPGVATLGLRLIGGLGHVLGITRSVGRRWFQETEQFVGGEADEIEIEVELLELGQLHGEPVVIPLGQGGSLVVSDAVGLGLRTSRYGSDVALRCPAPNAH